MSDDLIQFNNEALETSSDFEAKIRLNQLLLFQLERDQVLLKDEVDKGMKSVGQILSENYNTLNDSIESLKMFNNEIQTKILCIEEQLHACRRSENPCASPYT